MNLAILEEFINQIKEIAQKSKDDEFVNDGGEIYSKASYLKFVISEAEENIYYREYGIALEDMLDNLGEVFFVLDDKVINLARQAFGETITADQESRLQFLTKIGNDQKKDLEQS